jgi:hypothetical protein
VEYIAKRYINRKSVEKKKEQEREVLKKEVAKIANRNSKKEPAPFFKLNADTLRQLEHRYK